MGLRDASQCLLVFESRMSKLNVWVAWPVTAHSSGDKHLSLKIISYGFCESGTGRTAWSDGYGSVSLMRLQSSSQLGLSTSEGCDHRSQLVLGIGGRPQFLFTCTTLQDCLDDPITWSSAFPRVRGL